MVRSCWAVAAFLLLGCGGKKAAEPAPWSEAWMLREGERFLDSTAHRRAALEASLVNPENVYSRQRLKAYGMETSGWDALPVWNPRSRPVDAAAAAQLARGEWPARPAERVWDGTRPKTVDAWIELGRKAFFEFPLRPEFAVEHALMPRADGAPVDDAAVARAAALGVERTANGDIPGLVVFDDVDGKPRVGITCAVCHTTVRDGAVIAGMARRRLDLGALRLDYYRDTGAAVDPELARRMATWGPGRADVTEDDDEDPVAIPDLWGLGKETYLTQAGTIRHVGPAALAIRQETQLLHASGLRVRPPREVAWAMAMYLYAMPLPPRTRPRAEGQVIARGGALFDAHCRSCHASSIHAGDPIPAEKVGTDPSLAHGKARGTGRYRIAPLVNIADGAPYLHDGSVPSLEALLTSERLQAEYRGGTRGPGPIPGHLYGMDLPEADRAALITYVESL